MGVVTGLICSETYRDSRYSADPWHVWSSVIELFHLRFFSCLFILGLFTWANSWRIVLLFVGISGSKYIWVLWDIGELWESVHLVSLFSSFFYLGNVGFWLVTSVVYGCLYPVIIFVEVEVIVCVLYLLDISQRQLIRLFNLIRIEIFRTLYLVSLLRSKHAKHWLMVLVSGELAVCHWIRFEAEFLVLHLGFGLLSDFFGLLSFFT